MTGERDDSLDGLAVEAAADAVADREGTPDATTVRRTLEPVTTDGVVDRDAVDEAVGPVALAVSNASDALEVADLEIGNARDAAADAPDDERIAVSLADLEDRLDAFQSRHDDLTDALDEAVADRTTADLYAVARELGRVESAAEALSGEARALANDAEDLTAWLTDHDRRVAEFEADLSALGESLDDVAGAVDAFTEGAVADDPGRAWFGTVCSHRSQGPVVRDLQAELGLLRDWGADGDGTERLAERLADLESRWERLGTRLDEVADPDWRDRYGPDFTDIESSFADLDPPVDFAEVRAVLSEYQDRE